MRSVNFRQNLLIVFLLAVVIVACCGQAAFAVYVIQQNNYIYVKMGVGGTCPDPDPVSGRWSMGTVKGDPDNDQDDSMRLIREGGCDNSDPTFKWGYSTIYIDQKGIVFGDTDAGQWDISPYRADWPYDGLIGSYLVGYWREKGSKVTVKKKLQIIRDQVRIEYTIKNEDPQNEHSVGVRLMGDTMVEPTDRVAFPFIPGRGINMSELDLSGADIPEYFEMFDEQYNPKVCARNILRGQDATPPDRVAIGEWPNIVANDWVYSAVPDRAVDDHAWALWWNATVLQPGQTRTIVTYTGMGTATASWTSDLSKKLEPYVVAVSAPRTVTADSSGNLQSFEVKAYVYNLFHDIDISNVNVSISFTDDKSLSLINGAQRQSISSIARETESLPITWTVRPTGTVAGPVTIMIQVSGSPGLQKTVSRSITIPATYHKAVINGWQMISVPYELKDARPESALLPYDSVTDQILTSDLQALQWDADANDYKMVTSILPGDGFWLKFDDSSIIEFTLKAPGTTTTNATPLPSNQSLPIELKAGWNQFGNPYLYPIVWGRVKVLSSSQVGPISIEDAANRGWIRRTVYWFDANKGVNGEYGFSSNPLTQLLPWQGCWIKAITPCQLIIPPVEQIGAYSSYSSSSLSRMASAISGSAALVVDGWKLELKARAGDTITGSGCIGVDSRASDSYNPEDVEQPPHMSDYVTVTFPHQNWGANSGGFIQDVRRSGGNKVWDVEVATDKVNSDVVITWPGISGVPKNCRLRLEDIETGVRKDMRTTSSYRFNTGGSPTRRLKIVAESAGLGRLVISNLNVAASRATGTATVSYSLSTDAVTEVKVRKMSGQTVATIANGNGVTRGISTVAWNYRNQRGDRVPVGSYIIEVIATTPEGEVAKVVTPFIVAR